MKKITLTFLIILEIPVSITFAQTRISDGKLKRADSFFGAVFQE